MKKIYVTEPYLPPIEEFIPLIEQIWESKMLTNCGPFHQQLEEALCSHLGVKQVSLFSNGTIALLTALQALDISGEVITTPFSFIATSHALLWNNITPVFVDVDPETLNMDPKKIEEAITDKTTAILPVHCYGHPCNTDMIQRIAEEHGLKVIYDAAHAFGVEDDGGSVLRHGELSAISFHATKVFNTFEGGAIISATEEMKLKIDQLKNFGHAGEDSVVATGINGKMNEVSSALGLLQLKHIDSVLNQREVVDRRYRLKLDGIVGIRCLSTSGETKANYSYFPILVGDTFALSRDQLYDFLLSKGVHPRKYFYPLISEFDMYCDLPSSNVDNLSNASRAAEQILCLPIYPDLSLDQVDLITNAIISCQQSGGNSE